MMPGPLADRTVVVTRPRAQAPSLSEPLRSRGARVLEFPTVAIEPPADPAGLEDAIALWDRFDWLVCTSVNGVAAVVRAVEAAERDPGEALRALSVAAIGPATAQAVREAGGEVTVVPEEEYRAEALADALLREVGDARDVRLLVARAAGARPVLPERLRAAGGDVVEVAAYRTSVANPGAGRMSRLLRAGEVDWLTFTASSTVRNFRRLVDVAPGSARVACIGPITADTAREQGFEVDVTAREYTIPGLVRALVRAESDAAGARA